MYMAILTAIAAESGFFPAAEVGVRVFLLLEAEEDLGVVDSLALVGVGLDFFSAGYEMWKQERTGTPHKQLQLHLKHTY